MVRVYDWVHMQAAQWINANAARDAIIATHDIGILGYFTNRQIVDLAGLVTPEVVPIMEDHPKLADYLRSKHVSYMIVFRGLYDDILPQLNARLVFSPHPELMMARGGKPFEVYEINR